MRRQDLIQAFVSGVNRAIASYVAAEVEPWGSSQKIAVPGFRYLTFTPPLSEGGEIVQATISGWVRGVEAAEEMVAAITDELHADTWRTYQDIYCRTHLTGVRMNADEEPGVYRFDMDFELEAPRETAGRY